MCHILNWVQLQARLDPEIEKVSSSLNLLILWHPPSGSCSHLRWIPLRTAMTAISSRPYSLTTQKRRQSISFINAQREEKSPGKKIPRFTLISQLRSHAYLKTIATDRDAASVVKNTTWGWRFFRKWRQKSIITFQDHPPCTAQQYPHGILQE
jgi:hypothetical protein